LQLNLKTTKKEEKIDMRSQNFLNSIRLMTYTLVMSLFVINAFAGYGDDDKVVSGGEKRRMAEISQEQINIEQWMLNDDFFSLSNTEDQNIDQLALEDWMINGDFELKNSSARSEEQMSLESWMIQRSNFKLINDIKLESWMLDQDNFKTKEEKHFEIIEPWMINEDFFTI